MASRTDIANFALGHFGQSRITDIDQRDPSAIAVRDAWDIVRDECLRVFPWNFALHPATLSKVLPVPAFEWSNAFLLPADYIQLVRFNGVLTGTRDTEFTVMGQHLMANADVAQIVYVRRVVETEFWDPTFVKAFSFALAEAIAPKLNLSADSAERLAARKRDSGLSAMLAASIEGRPRVKKAADGSQYAAARRGEGGPS